MPVHVAKRSSSYIVTDAKGKAHGKHKTKEAAVKQAQAINIALHKRGK